jgi:hypothetical protein
LKFIDPLGEINGRPAMKQYYANVYKSVKEIRFEFTDHIYQGDTHIAVWVMYVKAGLKDGEGVCPTWNSHIKFGQVTSWSTIGIISIGMSLFISTFWAELDS